MLTRAEAAAELLRRRMAKESLIEFSQQVDIPGRPVTDQTDEARFTNVEAPIAAHHRLLMETLQRVSETYSGRAMVFMPPGSAKSTYGSVVFPAWFLGGKPGKQIILISYGANLAQKHGRRTRQLVATDRYREIFETTLAKDRTAVDQWALTNNAEYMASGILGNITGNRADGLIVDDPVAGRDEAESEVIRAKTKDAYNDDARNRLKPGGWRVIIQTRWHEDDLAGSILPEDWSGESGRILCRDGHEWEIICLPAESDRSDDPLGRPIGAGLWPEWFRPGHWDEFKSSPRSWLSLYQQKPTAEQGSYFKREWVHYYDALPDSLSQYKGDFTDLGNWGVSPTGNCYLVDQWNGQATADVWINALLGKCRLHQPMWFVGESGVIKKAVEPFLMKEMENQRTYVALEWLPSTGDKAAMARSFQALMSAGKIHWPRTKEAERIIDQLMKFPGGKYDDAVDMCSLFGRFIDRVWNAVQKPAKKAVVLEPELVISDFEPKEVETW